MIDPKTLSAEERAIWDHMMFHYRAHIPSGDSVKAYALAKGDAEAIIEARRALFAAPASEGAKVECPNCRQKVKRENDHYSEGSEMDMPGFYCQKPAPSSEMPEAVRKAIIMLRTEARGKTYTAGEMTSAAASLETFWRTHAQPRPKLEFPAVRHLVSKIRDWQSCSELAMHPSKLNELCFAALAELDAAEAR